MRRYGFLEEEKSRQKPIQMKAGEFILDIKEGPIAPPKYDSAVSTSDSNKTVTMTVSYSTNVA